jgi:hypothetical protein
MAEEMWQKCLWALRFEVNQAIADDVQKHVTAKIDAQKEQIDNLTTLLREAYPYLPLAISLAEELAEMFPDIARPQDKR